MFTEMKTFHFFLSFSACGYGEDGTCLQREQGNSSNKKEEKQIGNASNRNQNRVFSVCSSHFPPSKIPASSSGIGLTPCSLTQGRNFRRRRRGFFIHARRVSSMWPARNVHRGPRIMLYAPRFSWSLPNLFYSLISAGKVAHIFFFLFFF